MFTLHVFHFLLDVLHLSVVLNVVGPGRGGKRRYFFLHHSIRFTAGIIPLAAGIILVAAGAGQCAGVSRFNNNS